MARYITLDENAINDARKEFEELLSSGRFPDGKINFSKTIGKIDKKTALRFTESAWLKMRLLVDGFDKEVGWHGVAYRQEDGYLVTDILVYPQETTSTTVNTDRTSYDEWLAGLDDETFNNLRFQGHSHVNMGTSPSGTDEKDQKEWLDMLRPDMFYIFVITNKKNSVYAKIYDLAENICYESTDIVVSIIEDGTGILDFSEEAKKLVREKTYTAPKTTAPVTTYGQGSGKYTYSTKNAAGYNSYYGSRDDDDDDWWYNRRW